MSRMVQCPKCRAILQEPPPGHPYYKCGSCFTVLQAKHAAGGSGPQQPIGEDVPEHKKPRNLDPGSKVGPARRQQAHGDADDDPSSQFRRQKTLPSRLVASGRKGDSDSNSTEDEPPPAPDTGDFDTSAFRRQRTLPSRLPHATQRDEPGASRAGSVSKTRRAVVATKQDVSLPTKLQAALDKKSGKARRGSELKSKIVIPAGIQQMLRKKAPDGVEDLNPRLQALLEKKAAGSKGDKLRAGGEGAAIRKPISGSQSRDFTNERESKQAGGRAALREALLSGARQEGGQRSKVSSASFGEGGAEQVATIVEWAQANGVDPREALEEAGFRGEEVQHRCHVSASGDLRSASEGLADGTEHVERGGLSRSESGDTTVEHSDAEEEWEEEYSENGRFRGVPSSQNGRREAPVPRQQPQGGVDTSLPPLLPPPDAPQVVQCQHCTQMLAVPAKLPPAKKGTQKLRCGKCLQVSSFRVALGVGGGQQEVAVHTSASRKSISMNGEEEYHASPSRGLRSISFEGGGGRAGGGKQGPYKVSNSTKQSSSSAVRGSGGEEFRRRVVVNGVRVPDWVVENAEERAGPIHPGEFWYDSKAGFWGVMGGPCLGMIPAGIRELSTPMPIECAGGTTRVLVNGRELHRKDLELLRGRGLSETTHKSYLVDITGRVVEAATGQELRGLGKLAPS